MTLARQSVAAGMRLLTTAQIALCAPDARRDVYGNLIAAAAGIAAIEMIEQQGLLKTPASQ